MIREITDIDTLKEIVEFSWKLYSNLSSSSYPREDTCYDDMYQRCKNIMLHKDDRVLACYAGNKIVGTFILFVESKEKYAQSNGFFIDGDYKIIADEFMKYIEDNYKDYELYVGLPPENEEGTRYFIGKGFECIESSIKTLLLKDDFIYSEPSDDIENLDDSEFDIYAQFHDKYATDIYWTSERIKQSRNIWDIYVLKDNNQIVGSIFIKLYDDSAEIFGLFLDDKYKSHELNLLLKSVNEVLNKGKNEIQYFIEEDLKLQLETAQKIGFRPIDNYRSYMKKI